MPSQNRQEPNSKLSAFSNITNIKISCLRQPFLLHRLLQQSWWLKYVFISQNPCTPMDAHSFLAFRIHKYVHTIERIRMHRTHDISWIIRSNRNQPKIKRTSQVTYLFKCWTMWKRREFGSVVVYVFWKIGNPAVTCVAAEPDRLSTRSNGPGAPKSYTFVKRGTGRCVLTR